MQAVLQITIGELNLTGRGSTAGVTQAVKLFLSPDLKIPPGSKISVIHNGLMTDYAQSGKVAVFSNHQEISLFLFDKWA